MVKDIKYIIKRIIIGTCIAFAIMALKGNFMLQAHAKTYQGVKYYSDYDLVYNDNFPNQSRRIVDFDFHHNLDLPDDINTTYLINIPCSFSITYGALEWYAGQTPYYENIQDINFQYYIVGNYSQRWIPGTYTNGMLQFYVPGGTKLHKLVIYFTTPGNINQTYNSYYSISLNSGITYYKLDSTQDIINNQNNNTQAIVDSQQDINDSLNDSSTDNPNSDINNMSQKVASNNSITQLLTLPITLFQNVLNNINGSCSSYSLGSLYGHNLTLPCINLESLLGSTLWGIIDILISGLFILSFRKKMVDIFNHISSLNDRGNELE